MKNKGDYPTENPRHLRTNNKGTQDSIDSADKATEALLINPNLGDEADYVADGLEGADESDYVIEEDDHYAG